MKQLSVLLLAVALVSPAYAQKPTPQLTRAISKLHIVAPAAKPMLLHTGKPLTQIDKEQFLTAVMKAAPAGMKNRQSFPAQPSTINLTPSQYIQGYAHMVLSNPDYVASGPEGIDFRAGSERNIAFLINVQPNTAYLLDIKVDVIDSLAHFTIGVDSGITSNSTISNPETFAGIYGINEFAYGVVSNSEGTIVITMYSPDIYMWSFINCEITSRPGK